MEIPLVRKDEYDFAGAWESSHQGKAQLVLSPKGDVLTPLSVESSKVLYKVGVGYIVVNAEFIPKDKSYSIEIMEIAKLKDEMAECRLLASYKRDQLDLEEIDKARELMQQGRIGHIIQLAAIKLHRPNVATGVILGRIRMNER